MGNADSKWIPYGHRGMYIIKFYFKSWMQEETETTFPHLHLAEKLAKLSEIATQMSFETEINELLSKCVCVCVCAPLCHWKVNPVCFPSVRDLHTQVFYCRIGGSIFIPTGNQKEGQDDRLTISHFCSCCFDEGLVDHLLRSPPDGRD